MMFCYVTSGFSKSWGLGPSTLAKQSNRAWPFFNQMSINMGHTTVYLSKFQFTGVWENIPIILNDSHVSLFSVCSQNEASTQFSIIQVKTVQPASLALWLQCPELPMQHLNKAYLYNLQNFSYNPANSSLHPSKHYDALMKLISEKHNLLTVLDRMRSQYAQWPLEWRHWLSCQKLEVSRKSHSFASYFQSLRSH